MQARYYDPVIGRFYSNDPVGTLGHMQRGNSITHGFNRYAYAYNNPYKYVDPDGKLPFALALIPELVVVGEAALVAAGVIGTAAAVNSAFDQIDQMNESGESSEQKGRRRKNRIPDRGEPNSTATNPSGTTIKLYGEDGWVELEWNEGHGPDAPEEEQEDHVHDHQDNPHHPDGRPNRQPGRKPTQADLEKLGLGN